MTSRGRMFGCQTLLVAATLTACGSSSLSLAAIESEVAQQAQASLQNTQGLKIQSTATCAEMPNQTRTYDCRVRIKVNGRVSPSQEVTAIVSRDGKNVVVQGL